MRPYNCAADIFATVTPQADPDARWLTTRDAVKLAMGLTTTASDALIDTLIPRVSALIASECAVEKDAAANVASFASEAVRATYRSNYFDRGPTLILPWRVPVTAITSLTEDGDVLVAGVDYALVSAIPGRLQRLDQGIPIHWSWGEIVVDYTAGFTLPDNVPLELEAAAIEQIKMMVMSVGLNPAIRSQTVPDVYAASYTVPGGDVMGANVLLPQVCAMLSTWRNPAP